jgi:hypothetical protein
LVISPLAARLATTAVRANPVSCTGWGFFSSLTDWSPVVKLGSLLLKIIRLTVLFRLTTIKGDVMKKIFSMIVAAFVLSACAVGTPINWNNARQVQVGMTEDQVLVLMGRPYAVASRPEGQRWIWALGTSFGGSQSMSITFKDGKVIEVPPIPASFGS